MNSYQKIFKSRHLRATPQRLAVYEALVAGRCHLTAEEIYWKIKKNVPGLSLATVYTSLSQLKDRQLVSEVRIHPQRVNFEIKKDLHHHLLCRKCGQIIDLCFGPCDIWRRKSVTGHQIEDLHGYFYGICSGCHSRGRIRGQLRDNNGK